MPLGVLSTVCPRTTATASWSCGSILQSEELYLSALAAPCYVRLTSKSKAVFHRTGASIQERNAAIICIILCGESSKICALFIYYYGNLNILWKILYSQCEVVFFPFLQGRCVLVKALHRTKNSIFGPVMMLYWKSIWCYCCSWLLVWPHSITWHTAGKPPLPPHSNLSYCIFWCCCFHTHTHRYTQHSQIWEYVMPGNQNKPRRWSFH